MRVGPISFRGIIAEQGQECSHIQTMNAYSGLTIWSPYVPIQHHIKDKGPYFQPSKPTSKEEEGKGTIRSPYVEPRKGLAAVYVAESLELCGIL